MTNGSAPSGTGSSAGRRSPTLCSPIRRGRRSPARFRPGRARYLVETMRPTNAETAPAGAPSFPDTPRRAASWTRAVEATALPEHWVAVGYQAGEEVFRVWCQTARARPARRRPDAGPGGSAAGTAGTTRSCRDVQDAFRWALDLGAARDAGMALTVTEADLTSGHTLAHGLSRLVVAGVDWTLDPGRRGVVARGPARWPRRHWRPGVRRSRHADQQHRAQRSAFTTAPAEQVAEWAPPTTGADPDVSA